MYNCSWKIASVRLPMITCSFKRRVPCYHHIYSPNLYVPFFGCKKEQRFPGAVKKKYEEKARWHKTGRQRHFDKKIKKRRMLRPWNCWHSARRRVPKMSVLKLTFQLLFDIKKKKNGGRRGYCVLSISLSFVVPRRGHDFVLSPLFQHLHVFFRY